MANIVVTDWNSAEVGSCELSDDICMRSISMVMVKDVVVQHMANLSQGTRKTKTRAEISGSGKKLFRQKGTGNARAGSSKSPLRRHGGVVFGPLPGKSKIKVNKKVRKLALCSVLGQYIREQKVRVMEDFSLESHRTAALHAIIKSWEVNNIMFVSDEISDNFMLASRNLKYVSRVNSFGLTVYDILLHDCVVFTKNSLLQIQKRLLR